MSSPSINSSQQLTHVTIYLPFVGSVIFGLLPLCCGVWSNRYHILAYAIHKDIIGVAFLETFKVQIDWVEMRLPNTTFTILQYYWASVAMQVHLFHVLFVYQLTQTLRTVNTTKI